MPRATAGEGYSPPLAMEGRTDARCPADSAPQGLNRGVAALCRRWCLLKGPLARDAIPIFTLATPQTREEWPLYADGKRPTEFCAHDASTHVHTNPDERRCIVVLRSSDEILCALFRYLLEVYI